MERLHVSRFRLIIYYCLITSPHTAPGRFGQWADICGGHYLFGNQIVNKLFLKLWLLKPKFARQPGSKTLRNAAAWT